MQVFVISMGCIMAVVVLLQGLYTMNMINTLESPISLPCGLRKQSY